MVVCVLGCMRPPYIQLVCVRHAALVHGVHSHRHTHTHTSMYGHTQVTERAVGRARAVHKAPTQRYCGRERQL